MKNKHAKTQVNITVDGVLKALKFSGSQCI